MARNTLILALGLSVMLAATPSAAASSVVVLSIENAPTADLTRTLINLLSTNFEVVPEWRYRRAARRMRAKSLDPRSVRRVARRLGARVVIDGELMRANKLKLNVRRGSDGQLVKRYYVPLRRRALSRRNQRRLQRRLATLIRDVSSVRVTRRRARRARVERRERDRRTELPARDSRRIARRDRGERGRSRLSRKRPERRLGFRERRRLQRERRLEQARERRQRIADARRRRVEAKRRAADERRQRIADTRRRQAEKKRRATDERRRAREAKRAAKRRKVEAKRRKAEAKRRKAQREREAERKLFEEKVDDDGMVIDDEVPDVLKKKK